MIKVRNKIIVCFCVLATLPVRAELSGRVVDLQPLVISYSFMFGATISTGGIFLNSSESWNKKLTKGILQGLAGGGILYLSKLLTSKLATTGNRSYLWPSKILNSVGLSILDNTIKGKLFWENFHIYLGPLRFDYDILRNDISARILPLATLINLANLVEFELDVKNTLLSGTFIYRDKNNTYPNAYSQFSTIVIPEEIYSNELKQNMISHEIIHTFQYYEYTLFNGYLNKLDNHLKESYSLYNGISKFVYLDIPYSLFAYGLFKTPRQNYFEIEANYFSFKNNEEELYYSETAFFWE